MEPSKSTPQPAPTFLPRLVPHLFPRKQCSASCGSRRRRTVHCKSPVARDAAQQERNDEIDKWFMEEQARNKRVQVAMDASKALNRVGAKQEAQEKRKQALRILAEGFNSWSPPPITLRLALVLRKGTTVSGARRSVCGETVYFTGLLD
ncbi:hypothetical protein BD779DRAFT_1803007 [Infundibulicybe gibba]|nr:hypothetical protein BD779DRAFT_1803007 [Infundibulicybe gibba]